MEDQPDLSYMEVERSDDASSFAGIGTVNSSASHLYTFIDDKLSDASLLYYRLKIVNISGDISYSNIVRIKTNNTNQFRVEPNPVSGNLNIAGVKNHGYIKIFDLAGKTIFQKEALTENLSMDVSLLNRGIYVQQYFDGLKTQTLKFLKQ